MKGQHAKLLLHISRSLEEGCKDKEPVQADDKGVFVTFTERFKYLGSSLDESLSDDAEVSKRTKTASGGPFGAMRKQVSSQSTSHVKPKRLHM